MKEEDMLFFSSLNGKVKLTEKERRMHRKHGNNTKTMKKIE
jgi:hypothetical protein